MLELTFERVSVGTTPLTFTTASFGNKQSQRVPVVSDNGELNIVDPTTPSYTNLLANMGVQGTLDREGVKLSLAPGETHWRSYEGLSEDLLGNNLLIENVAIDTYTVTASREGCLSASGTIVIPADTASYNLPALVLRSGNAQDEDNVIDVNDLAIVNGAYNNFDLNPQGDLNFDGLIDARDLALVAGNFGLTSEAAYPVWLP